MALTRSSQLFGCRVSAIAGVDVGGTFTDLGEGEGLVDSNTPQSMANFAVLDTSKGRYSIGFDYFGLRGGSGGMLGGVAREG